MNTPKPEPDKHLPAQRITTPLAWADLLLPGDVLTQIEQIFARLRAPLQNNPIGNGGLQTGLRVLFSGPPGTGKTLTACLLGKGSGNDVYRVDLAEVLSRCKDQALYNLSMVFAVAADKQWLLYFNGTDALFGKPVVPGDTRADEQMAKLLQYLKTYPGVVIMSTTLSGTINAAAVPVFDFEVNFPVPDAALRLRLWQNHFVGHISLDVNLPDLARDYAITGGDIINVLRYCAIKSNRDGKELITLADIREGLLRVL